MNYADLLIWQYQNRPKARSTIQLLVETFSQVFSELYSLQSVLSIETAIGHQLDLVGKHVGQHRVINGYQLRRFFGFRGSAQALGFSKREQGGGIWYRRRDPLSDSVRLADEDYRFLIKCRILRNYQIGTLPNIIEACQFIFGQGCRVVDNYNMTVSINVPKKNITDFKKFAIEHLDILPRQAGVKLHYQII